MTNPVTKTDLEFLKHFSMLIAALMLVTLVLIFFATVIYADHPPQPSPKQAVAQLARIKPAGAVYSGDTGRAAMAAAQEAALKAAAAQVAYGGTLDGGAIYGQLCQACHTSGAGGAPKLEKAAWAARVAQGTEVLLQHAIAGYTGSAGLMPARGGNPSLTDEQVKATVEWMVANLK